VNVLELCQAAVLSSWLLVTILLHLPISGRLRDLDLFGVVPVWNFFAPNPGKSDFHLLRRYRSCDGSYSDWREVRLLCDRPWYAFLWNPQKRLNKLLLDLCTSLSEARFELDDHQDAILLSPPYLFLLCFLEGLGRPEGANGLQFLVMYSESCALRVDPAGLFISAVHDLG
jgi:hypothetical protein